MANEDYKNGKLVEIVREFNHIKGTTRYEINGITQSIAVPFWREEEGKFKVVPKGSYKFINEAGNNYLEITDESILQQATQFQIVYVYSQISSKYIEDFPELSVLTTKYNELVDDATKLFSYLKSVGMIADTLQMTKVLSQLEPLTTWYMDENGEIKTLPISELYNKFQQMIDTLYKEIKALLMVDYEDMSNKLSQQTTTSLKQLSDKTVELKKDLQTFADKLEKDKKVLIDDYVEKTSKTTINNHVETVSKPEINKYVENTTKPSIDNYVNNTSKPELNNYVNNVLKKNLDEYNTVKKKEIDEVKTKAISEITVQENSTLQNILNAESKSVKVVEDKGTTEKKELEDMAVDIKTQLELLLQNADIANLQTLIGNRYKGVYSAFNKYYSGDIYYKKDTEVVALTIPDRVSNTVAMLIPTAASPAISKEMTSEDTGTMASPELTKTSSTQNIKKFFRLYGDIEREYNFTDNGDNKITGFELGDYNRFIRTNSTIEFELNTINYTIAVNFPNTEVTDLVKAMTTEQDNSAVTLVKKQTDLPLYTLDTQRDPVLRKIHY